MALTDSLTELDYRLYLEAHVGGLLDRISMSGKLLSLMIFDIDFFQNVNDNHGHQVGDDVLREIAHRVTHNVRRFDTVARLGGEEFVVVMPDTDLTVEIGRAHVCTPVTNPQLVCRLLLAIH